MFSFLYCKLEIFSSKLNQGLLDCCTVKKVDSLDFLSDNDCELISLYLMN